MARCADEAFWAGDRKAIGVLKALVTESTLQIEMKHRDAFRVKNHISIIMASNNDWVVLAALDERRFAVFDVAETRKQDRPFFERLIHQLEHGGYEALLCDLLHFDLGSCGVDPCVIPKTAALLDQKLAFSCTGQR